VGTGSNGWGNQELQYYTKDSLNNARVENGTLIITARKEKIGQCNYTSARLVTKNKGDWLYGRFEIAAKLPIGRGLWPAIWMLPTDWAYGDWPKSGELDIMENVGFDPYLVHFNIHTEAYNHSIGTNKGASATLDDPHTKFNVYALEWDTNSVVFFANDKKIFTFNNEKTGYKTWPFDKRFHLLLNIAVGGSWGGQQGVDDAIFPKEMVIDYVRVFERSTLTTSHQARSAATGTNTLTTAVAVNGTLTVHSPSPSAIRLFSLNGKLLADCSPRCTASGGAIAIPLTLPGGTSIAVIDDRQTGRHVFNIFYDR
jgi:beta-glucanase (GH16 family)